MSCLTDAVASSSSTAALMVNDYKWRGLGPNPCYDIRKTGLAPIREVTDLALAVALGAFAPRDVKEGSPEMAAVVEEWHRRYPERPCGYKGWAQDAHVLASRRREAAGLGVPFRLQVVSRWGGAPKEAVFSGQRYYDEEETILVYKSFELGETRVRLEPDGALVPLWGETLEKLAA